MGTIAQRAGETVAYPMIAKSDKESRNNQATIIRLVEKPMEKMRHSVFRRSAGRTKPDLSWAFLTSHC